MSSSSSCHNYPMCSLEFPWVLHSLVIYLFYAFASYSNDNSVKRKGFELRSVNTFNFFNELHFSVCPQIWKRTAHSNGWTKRISSFPTGALISRGTRIISGTVDRFTQVREKKRKLLTILIILDCSLKAAVCNIFRYLDTWRPLCSNYVITNTFWKNCNI